MSTAKLLAGAAVAIGVAFAAGLATAPARRAPPAEAQAAPAPAVVAAPTAPPPPRKIAPGHLPAERRFEPPELPVDEPQVAELVSGSGEVPKAALEQRWSMIDARLDELFGKDFPADKRAKVRAAQDAWITDHAAGVRAYYQGRIDQGELSEYVHANMITFSSALEKALSRDEFRTFTDLEPGEDPYIALVPPGTSVAGPVNGDENDPTHGQTD